MEDQTLIYNLVTKKTRMLAKYTSYSRSFNTIVAQCLEKLPENNKKHTYVCDHHTFNFLVEDGFMYLAVADKELGQAVPFASLERMKDAFMHWYQGRYSGLCHS